MTLNQSNAFSRYMNPTDSWDTQSQTAHPCGGRMSYKAVCAQAYEMAERIIKQIRKKKNTGQCPEPESSLPEHDS
jgi:hypothetical protein